MWFRLVLRNLCCFWLFFFLHWLAIKFIMRHWRCCCFIGLMVSVLFLCVNNIFCSVPFWFTVAVKIKKKKRDNYNTIGHKTTHGSLQATWPSSNMKSWDQKWNRGITGFHWKCHFLIKNLPGLIQENPWISCGNQSVAHLPKASPWSLGS